MQYTLERNNNIFTITDNSINTLYVTVFVQTFCGSNVWEVLIPEQTVNTSLVITLPGTDNLYKIVVTDKQDLYETYDIFIYSKFLTSLIEEVDRVMCGCPCQDCNDCGKEATDYLAVFTKLLAYNIVKGGTYNTFLTATNGCVICNVLDSNQCILTTETILGSSDNTLLMKRLIAYYYLVFYYADLKMNNNSATVTAMYNYNKIIQCIKKLGVDESCIKNTIFAEPQGIYTFEFDNTFM